MTLLLQAVVLLAYCVLQGEAAKSNDIFEGDWKDQEALASAREKKAKARGESGLGQGWIWEETLRREQEAAQRRAKEEARRQKEEERTSSITKIEDPVTRVLASSSAFEVTIHMPPHPAPGTGTHSDSHSG